MKYEAIILDDMKKVMDGVTKELAPLSILEARDKKALASILGSMISMLSDIFAYLPEDERSNILVNCATWYDIGFLAGRLPGKLTEIMDKVNPAIEEVELPDWIDKFVHDLTK